MFMSLSALKNFVVTYKKHISFFFIIVITILVASFSFLYFHVLERLTNQTLIASDKESKIGSLSQQLTETQKQFEQLKNQDQIKINHALTEEIDNIQKTYKLAVETYEKLQDAK